VQDDDDALVSEREEELAAELRAEITALGEAGWLSPFFTGSSYDLTHGAADPRHFRYKLWREDRDKWTQTGDPVHLTLMLRNVTWTVPPDGGEAGVPVTLPVRHRWAWSPVRIGLAALGGALFMVLLMCVAAVLFR
jgi:hypothetical protein